MAEALKPHCIEEPADVGDGTVLRYRKTPPKPETLSLFDAAGDRSVADAAGLAHAHGAARDARALAPLSPSQLYDETAPIARRGGAARRQALARGVVMHRLLQSLPAIAPEQRAEAARRYLARQEHATSRPRNATELARKALALIERSALRRAVLAAEQGRGSDRRARGSRRPDPRRRRRGRPPGGDRRRDPDRRLQDESRPARSARRSAARATSRSLRSTAPCSRELYPGRPVRAALVWTEVPDLMEVSAAAMDAALAAAHLAVKPA